MILLICEEGGYIIFYHVFVWFCVNILISASFGLIRCFFYAISFYQRLDLSDFYCSYIKSDVDFTKGKNPYLMTQACQCGYMNTWPFVL